MGQGLAPRRRRLPGRPYPLNERASAADCARQHVRPVGTRSVWRACGARRRRERSRRLGRAAPVSRARRACDRVRSAGPSPIARRRARVAHVTDVRGERRSGAATASFGTDAAGPSGSGGLRRAGRAGEKRSAASIAARRFERTLETRAQHLRAACCRACGGGAARACRRASRARRRSRGGCRPARSRRRRSRARRRRTG